MNLKGFTRAGHLPTLIAALLYFDVSFMTWVLGARWSLQWDTRALKQAGVYSYRQALFGIDTERAA